MGKDRSSKKSRPAVKLMFVALIAMTAFQSKSAFSQVKCYKGDTQAGNFIGEVSVITLQNAGRDCNSTYPACQGQCIGCIYDSNLSKNICYDSLGTIFPKLRSPGESLPIKKSPPECRNPGT